MSEERNEGGISYRSFFFYTLIFFSYLIFSVALCLYSSYDQALAGAADEALVEVYAFGQGVHGDGLVDGVHAGALCL